MQRRGATHAENVFWPEGGAPTGEYEVYIYNWSGCGEPTAYELRITVAGDVQMMTGTLASGEFSETTTFTA